MANLFLGSIAAYTTDFYPLAKVLPSTGGIIIHLSNVFPLLFKESNSSSNICSFGKRRKYSQWFVYSMFEVLHIKRVIWCNFLHTKNIPALTEKDFFSQC